MEKERFSLKKYLIDVLNYMAQGLFSSLIIGLILKQIGDKLGFTLLTEFGKAAQFLMGPAIGASVAYGVKAPVLSIFSSIITGTIGAQSLFLTDTGLYSIKIGEPVGALIAALIGAELGKLVQGKTKLNIILVPAVTIIAGGFTGIFISPIMSSIMTYLGNVINYATELQPLPMGIAVSVAMGMLLTLPISSAALAISLKLSGLAAGAATVGCCAQMIGFAISSFRENRFGGLIAQGLGTSMLQVPNIIKNPLIWIPPTLSSAILGPIASTLFKMKNTPAGAGMGTSGLVGQFATIEAMGAHSLPSILILHILAPAVLSLLISEFMRTKGLIKYGDMKLDL
ncbi:PTS sugar transporter subunit IIC [Clostridium bovifaecis]|uniref:PTS sugar transporter subunit IIC n=1 Tax=Clostridium bovifaecis TaxID=2184719 RepID=A0A6I6F8F5_9CLOT|nr:PTS sugar transporter subunit IIC [Clostridium bovifaecis]